MKIAQAFVLFALIAVVLAAPARQFNALTTFTGDFDVSVSSYLENGLVSEDADVAHKIVTRAVDGELRALLYSVAEIEIPAEDPEIDDDEVEIVKTYLQAFVVKFDEVEEGKKFNNNGYLFAVEIPVTTDEETAFEFFAEEEIAVEQEEPLARFDFTDDSKAQIARGTFQGKAFQLSVHNYMAIEGFIATDGAIKAVSVRKTSIREQAPTWQRMLPSILMMVFMTVSRLFKNPSMNAQRAAAEQTARATSNAPATSAPATETAGEQEEGAPADSITD